MDKQSIKPLVSAVSLAFMATIAVAPVASAAANPFQAD